MAGTAVGLWAGVLAMAGLAFGPAAAEMLPGLDPELAGAWSVHCERGPSTWRRFSGGRAVGPGSVDMAAIRSERSGSRVTVVYDEGSTEVFEWAPGGLRYLALLRPDGSVAVDWAARGTPVLVPCVEGGAPIGNSFAAAPE